MRAGDITNESLADERIEPPVSTNGDPEAQSESPIEIISAARLVQRYPKLRAPLLHGLLRRGETANIIGASKMLKSWNVLHLGIACASGGEWLSFRAEPCRVLIADNELHRETLSHRIRTVCAALHVAPESIDARLDFMPLRGRLSDIYRIGERISEASEHYDLVILDALYRALPKGIDENSNSSMAEVYNAIDGFSTKLDTSFVIIHHSSKGTQTGKAVTDVGSGAGAQSRAVDTHIILRPHEADGVLVFEAACRSWPPIEPRCLRLEFPLWIPAHEHDPEKLRTARRAKTGPTEAQVKAFVERFIATTSRPKGRIEVDAYAAGHSQRETRKLLKLAEELGYAWRHVPGPKLPHQFSTVPPADADSDQQSEAES